MPISSVIGIVGLILFIYISVWWALSVFTKRADIADIAWGPGFMLVAWSSFILGNFSVAAVVVNSLVTIWALRLAVHLFLRTKGRKEDFRYQTLKSTWGNYFNFRLFTDVFLLQGSILLVVAFPIIWINTHPQEIGRLSLFTAVPLWGVGFLIETVADFELALFKKNPANKDKLLTNGLWGYVRHPNYLGELMQWWAIWLIATTLPFGWALVISPLLLTFIIIKISGVKPLTEKFKNHPQFKDYFKNTPAIMPPLLMKIVYFGLICVALIIYSSRLNFW